jgi:hypothetical protein
VALLGKWLGATWPNHGLPRGTLGLANEGYVKKFLGPGDSNPGPPPHIAPSYQISDQRAIGWFLLHVCVAMLFDLD